MLSLGLTPNLEPGLSSTLALFSLVLEKLFLAPRKARKELNEPS
jgi:hypothetical protein